MNTGFCFYIIHVFLLYSSSFLFWAHKISFDVGLSLWVRGNKFSIQLFRLKNYVYEFIRMTHLILYTVRKKSS